jgi:hypothetical protein
LATTPIRVLKLPGDQFLIVELDESAHVSTAEIAQLAPANRRSSKRTLPSDAEEVSAAGKIEDAANLLYKQIEGLGTLARQSIASASPQQVQIEAYVKFTGDVNIVPFLVSTKGEGGLKITLTWKNE